MSGAEYFTRRFLLRDDAEKRLTTKDTKMRKGGSRQSLG